VQTAYGKHINVLKFLVVKIIKELHNTNKQFL